MKKLWTVNIETSVVVYAETEADARDVVMYEAWDDAVDSYHCEVSPRPYAGLPSGWTNDCLPYGTDGDATIAEILTREVKSEEADDA